MTHIRLAATDAEIDRCFPVMVQLRPHVPADEFVRQVRRQIDSDRYELAFLEEESTVMAVAGFRLGECLAWGRYMYVYDLNHRARFVAAFS